MRRARSHVVERPRPSSTWISNASVFQTPSTFRECVRNDLPFTTGVFIGVCGLWLLRQADSTGIPGQPGCMHANTPSELTMTRARSIELTHLIVRVTVVL